ncbi:HpcH/HpaI aldolase/citrate lyase family protein [Nocardia sp. NPDC059239]|uniref:HpcH/HpaI aldolase/citrate lyase family protein n=1 Tax=unclassified Nocardia TaxID=2637762 RepID=UPI0036B29857
MNPDSHILEAARSWLFVPGDRPERFSKAGASGADVVVCDLEDAVAPGMKDRARNDVQQWLMQGGRACVRINGASTAWFADDLASLSETPGLLAIMVPKADDPDVMAHIRDIMPGNVALIALVETALGVRRALNIAATPGVLRLAFGSLDYALDIDAEPDPSTLQLPRSELVAASRIAGLPGPVDGVTTALREQGRVAEDARFARRLGMTGKLCIHPQQVHEVNAALSPSDPDIEWAHRVLAAVGQAGAVDLDGQMIDKPVVDRAHRIVGRAGLLERHRPDDV